MSRYSESEPLFVQGVCLLERSWENIVFLKPVCSDQAKVMVVEFFTNVLLQTVTEVDVFD